MTLNWTWLWGSSSWVLGGGYLFISTSLTRSGITWQCSINGQIDLLKDYLHSIRPCVKKKILRNHYTRIQIWTYNERDSLTNRHKISLDVLTCHFFQTVYQISSFVIKFNKWPVMEDPVQTSIFLLSFTHLLNFFLNARVNPPPAKKKNKNKKKYNRRIIV